MPFGERRADQQMMNQMLREVMGLSSSQSPARDFELPLAVDAADEGSAYVFRADIPGVLRTDLKVPPRVSTTERLHILPELRVHHVVQD